MKLNMTSIALILLLCSSAHAGTYGNTPVAGSKHWKSTSCQAPHKPQLSIESRREYNEAVDDYNAYIEALQHYMQCIEREGRSDIRTIQISIEKNYTAKQKEVRTQLDKMKKELITQRQKLWPGEK